MDYSCIRVTQYNAEYVKEGEVKALDKISEYLSDDHVVWISVRGLQDTNLIGIDYPLVDFVGEFVEVDVFFIL